MLNLQSLKVAVKKTSTGESIVVQAWHDPLAVWGRAKRRRCGRHHEVLLVMCRYPSSHKAASTFDIQKNKQQTIPIIQPTSLLLQNSGICQPPPAKETENLRKKMKKQNNER